MERNQQKERKKEAWPHDCGFLSCLTKTTTYVVNTKGQWSLHCHTTCFTCLLTPKLQLSLSQDDVRGKFCSTETLKMSVELFYHHAKAVKHIYSLCPRFAFTISHGSSLIPACISVFIPFHYLFTKHFQSRKATRYTCRQLHNCIS